MIKKRLSIIASWLYHNDPKNKARFEIYQAIDHKHPADEIKHQFSKETAQAIENINSKIKQAEALKLKELKRLKKTK
tara:strand:+ start:509 stop:739 length:231 start_codon:yes stop_codon:yes gene_type:complete